MTSISVVFAIGWLLYSRSDTPFARLFPFDIIKPQSSDATFFSRGWLDFGFPGLATEQTAKLQGRSALPGGLHVKDRVLINAQIAVPLAGHVPR